MAYTFENGTWGTYDDGIKGSLVDFHRRRESLGFMESRKLVSLLGEVTVYSRSDKPVKWPYSYLCLVEVVSGYVWVWIKNVPSLFAFLQSIQAHRERDIDVSISNFDELKDVEDVPYYLRRTHFPEAMEELHKYFKKKNSEQGGK